MATQPDEYDFDPSVNVYAGGDPNPSALPDDDEFEEDFGNELEPSSVTEEPEEPVEEPEEPVEEPEEPAEEPEEPAAEIQIPKHRFDEVSKRMREAEQREKALEERLRALEKAGETPKDTGPTLEDEIATLENTYLQQALDGDIEDAAATRAQIRQKERELFRQESSTVTDQALTKRQAEAAINDAVAVAQSEYPALDENSDSYDAEAVTDTLALFESYIQRGTDPGKAMAQATERTARMYGWAKPGAAETAEPAPAPKVTPKPSAKDVERAAKAADSQPPKLQTGRQADDGNALPDVMDLTEEEFDALPLATQKRMRGDMV